ncbi:MAG: urea amidolyase, partial [Psychromonas sp.]
VSQHSDRMGIRLSGEKISSYCSGIISEGISLGAIQIPADGQPIILLNDRQTLGGYPKIGCVSKTDLAKLAQAAPNTVIRFHLSDFATCTKKWIDFMRFFAINY